MFESKTFRAWFVAALLIGSICRGESLSAQEKQQTTAPSARAYRVRVGDQIRIEVYQHSELSKIVIVDRKGNITLPSVHVVKVSDISITDLLDLVKRKLQPVVSNPQVTVIVGNSRRSPSYERPYDCCAARNGF
jgi:protein involved in polysaccharide export with SLBB domain